MDWNEFQIELERLSKKINFSPDIVIGIVRGGIIPARLLSKNLKVKDMYCLTIKKIGSERKVTSEITETLSGKKIILVEDMLETGKSLIEAKKYLREKGATVKTACLYSMPESAIHPDFYLRDVTEIVKFPWE